MVLNGVMPVFCILSFLLELLVLNPGVLYGYMVFDLIQGVIIWPIICVLILKERRYMFPTPPSRGHGIILLIFWTTQFALQNLILLNVENPLWFFKLKTFSDAISFSLFVFKYVVVGGIFLLGLKAPGIPTVRHSESFARLYPDGIEETNDNMEDGSGDRESRVWKIWSHIKLMSPYIWPKKSLLLQFYVLVCFICLILVRLTNVFVPLYSKKIGKYKF